MQEQIDLSSQDKSISGRGIQTEFEDELKELKLVQQGQSDGAFPRQEEEAHHHEKVALGHKILELMTKLKAVQREVHPNENEWKTKVTTLEDRVKAEQAEKSRLENLIREVKWAAKHEDSLKKSEGDGERRLSRQRFSRDRRSGRQMSMLWRTLSAMRK
ncbi:unnamed protein product [Pleuronectes platessa]|uniref:Uncharacterized protein n=1 Tax=Pleuronectes platessa TaxID=8262 RepID=A0A9N7TTJ2_PLEPL|nr:unnamed protein product [Pleuronectes platessa]